MVAAKRPFTRTPCGIYGHRHLVRRHARREKDLLLGTFRDRTSLEPGEENLYSFYGPGLGGGKYTLSVDQHIKTPSGEEKTFPQVDEGKPAVQDFEVVVPRFNLPEGSIHSAFPPQGSGALSNTLPHVVLTDPHLPWDRLVSAPPDEASLDSLRNRVPWLALLVFTPEELTLEEKELRGEDSIFKGTSLEFEEVKQSQELSVRMDIPDIPNLKNTVSPVTELVKAGHPDTKTSGEVIFVPKSLFVELVTKYDDDGNSLGRDQHGPDLSRYKYLAHVRDVNTTGMAEAGTEDNGLFGIAVSHRVGPLTATQPKSTVAHLVSLEGCESEFMQHKWPEMNDKSIKYVAMSSLYSWTYLTLPKGSFNFATALENLSENVTPLRISQQVMNNMEDKVLKARLQDGFTMTKYRTVTGEETAAFNRSPFTPTRVPYPILKNTWHSNSGIDLQILDPDVGLMDLTYSTAWQLGRSLAVADQAFTTALGRLRSSLKNKTMNNVKAEILAEQNMYRSLEDTALSLLKTIPALNNINKERTGLFSAHGSISDRWQRQEVEAMDLSFGSDLVRARFSAQATRVGEGMMMSTNGIERFDELNTPTSVEWYMVLKWVLDRLFFHDFPAHYLVTDPNHLPMESVRFFHIDRNWTDAMIDGALSIGNHGDHKDTVRKTIIGMINEHLYPTKEGVKKPQLPTYGFLLRSDIVTQVPDLRVTVNLDPSITTTAILRQDILDQTNGVMLCLLDKLPGEGLQSIQFTQPPHQQTFIAAFNLNADTFTTHYKRIFTLEGQKPNSFPWEKHTWKSKPITARDTDSPTEDEVKHVARVFNWGSNDDDPEVRTLLFPAWAIDANSVLNYYGKKTNPHVYDDPVPNSAMVGIQLNSPIYRLTIGNAETNVAKEDEAVASFPPVTESSLRVTSSPQLKAETHVSQQRTQIPLRSRRPAAMPRPSQAFHPGPSHGSPLQPPPHSRPLRAVSPPPPGPGTITSETDIPRFTVTCFPVDNNPRNPGVPCGTGILKDLVFNVRQDSSSSSTGDTDKGNLTHLTIYLQLPEGTSTSRDRDKACLIDSYTGPGPFMLSNVRFVVQAQINTVEEVGRTLVLRLVPRSVKGHVPAKHCKELSFILPVVKVKDRDIETSVPIWIKTGYVGYNETLRRWDNVVWLAKR